jgi:hypothetical protein
MPASLVVPKHVPICPNRNSRFTIRQFDGEWWVHYEMDGTFIPADEDHSELVALVNDLKTAEGNAPGGAFSITEHSQVIARMTAPAGYQQKAIHVVDISGGVVWTCPDTITFQDGSLDPTVEPEEGSPWPGPRCGSSYTFAAPGNRKPPTNKLDEIWTEIEGQLDLLSTHITPNPYPPANGPLADFLAALRRQLPQGGRFRVNEHGRAFTANQNLFIGTVPLDSWFPPLGIV